MIIKTVNMSYLDYKVPGISIIFPTCTFKCEQECGIKCCQNSSIVKTPDIQTTYENIVDLYKKNTFCHALICEGLEPIDSFDDLLGLLKCFRSTSEDDFVIYTGYTEDEIKDKIEILKKYKNVVIKFGRFIPNDEPHYDEVLGVKLASKNQYAKRIS